MEINDHTAVLIKIGLGLILGSVLGFVVLLISMYA